MTAGRWSDRAAERALARGRHWLSAGPWPPADTDAAGAAQRAVGIWLADRSCPAPPHGQDRSGSRPTSAAPVTGGLRRQVLAALQTAPEGGRSAFGHPFDALRADPAVLLRAADEVGSATAFGTDLGRMADDTRSAWSEVLPIALATAVRGHDLDAGAALLRASVFLGLADHAATQGAGAFLTARQRPDGGFGGAAAEAKAPGDAAVRLPLTVSCVWALAELRRPGVTAEAFAR
ncbi:hypothetical protein CDO52_03695 [Nocardiopsis gilva YIM 90087]|uniref:Uncharacterized protein n=1 Tax=Nocardiopsis gilva YIM 90087 TaxID=1235441 RepID=A0A223S1J1_9ACTN|nr:hypothetical protein CDO52_03695 [Nocardiopsis gilva YIM 90087]